MIIRRTDKYGYSRYYGGGGPAFWIKIVVAILLVVGLVVGAAAFVMQRYMVYTEEGGHLELPWSLGDKSQPEGDGSGSGLEGLIVTEEDRSEDKSADASKSEDKSADASKSEDQSGDASKSEEQSADASKSADESASQSAPAQSGSQDTADSSVPVETQPGLWERFVAWLKKIFQPVQTAPLTPANGSTSAGVIDQTGTAQTPEREEEQQGDTSSDKSESGDQSQKTEKKRPEALSDGLLIQHVSIGDVKGGFAEGDIKNKKGNGIMLFMKESGGKLNFRSNQGLAEELGVNAEESTGERIAEVVTELKGKDYYTLAYVDCFQDQSAREESDLRLYNKDRNAWTDGEDRAWADPSNARYQNYLVALIRELNSMGFDEVVLKNACYPATGNTDRLHEDCYDTEKLRDTVGGFYKKLQKELKDCDCLVSFITTEEAIEKGYDEATGQSLENMLQLGGRLWVDADRDKAEDLNKKLEEAGYPDNALGLLVSSLQEDDKVNQMNPD